MMCSFHNPFSCISYCIYLDMAATLTTIIKTQPQYTILRLMGYKCVKLLNFRVKMKRSFQDPFSCASDCIYLNMVAMYINHCWLSDTPRRNQKLNFIMQFLIKFLMKCRCVCKASTNTWNKFIACIILGPN